MSCRSSIISSTPGRVRIRLSSLYKQEKYAKQVKSEIEEINGIIFAEISRKTGNMLVLYSPELLNEEEILFHISNTVSSEINEGTSYASHWTVPDKRKTTEDNEAGRRKNSQADIFHNEKQLIRRLRNVGIVIGGIVFWYTRSLSRLLAVLILSNPMFVFAAPISAYYSAIRLAKTKGINVRRIGDMKALQEAKAVFINDSILFYNNGRNLPGTVFMRNIDRLELKKQIYLEEAADPVTDKVRSLVFLLREMGIIDITVINSHHNELAGYMAEDLGIKEITLFDRNRSCLELDNQDIVILTVRDKMVNICGGAGGFIICINGHKGVQMLNANMTLRYRDIDKIPAIIELGRYSRELTIRSQSTGLAANAIGILLAASGYMNPLTAIILSIANAAFQAKYSMKKLSQFEKEHFND